MRHEAGTRLDAGKAVCSYAQRVGETPQRLPGIWAIGGRSEPHRKATFASCGRYIRTAHRPKSSDDHDDQNPSCHATTDAAHSQPQPGCDCGGVVDCSKNAVGPAVAPAVRFPVLHHRSGSAYLIDLLASTGVFAQALETLNADAVLRYYREHGVQSFPTYIERIVRRDARNGIYIVKVAPEQLRLLTETAILGQIGDRAEFRSSTAPTSWARRSPGYRGAESSLGLELAVRLSRRQAGVFRRADRPAHLRHRPSSTRPSTSSSRSTASSPISVEYERLLEPAAAANCDEIAPPPAAARGRRFDPARLTSRPQANAVNHAVADALPARSRNRLPATTAVRRPPPWPPPASARRPRTRPTSLPTSATSATCRRPQRRLARGGRAPASWIEAFSIIAAAGPDPRRRSNTAAFRTSGGCCPGRPPAPTPEPAA